MVLAPLPLVAIWFGGVFLQLLTASAASVMAWEWGRLCGGGRSAMAAPVLVAVVLASVAGATAAGVWIGVAIALGGAAVVWALALREPDTAPLWMAAGSLWVALPCGILLWLADSASAGRATLLWVFAVVWATDIGAYVAGRVLGGPRLAPRWSPGKTWAGLGGGMVCAALAGWATAVVLGTAPAPPLVLASAGLAIVGQFGDLAESVVKRRFGVKDASSLIPGHGGLLDRLDGLLAVIPVVALLTFIGGGSVLTWR